MTRDPHLATLDPARTTYSRTIIGGLGSGRTRRECWGAWTADGLWEFEREESEGTPWLLRWRGNGEDIIVSMHGTLRACRLSVGRGWAAAALEQRRGEMAVEAIVHALRGFAA